MIALDPHKFNFLLPDSSAVRSFRGSVRAGTCATWPQVQLHPVPRHQDTPTNGVHGCTLPGGPETPSWPQGHQGDWPWSPPLYRWKFHNGWSDNLWTLARDSNHLGCQGDDDDDVSSMKIGRCLEFSIKESDSAIVLFYYGPTWAWCHTCILQPGMDTKNSTIQWINHSMFSLLQDERLGDFIFSTLQRNLSRLL